MDKIYTELPNKNELMELISEETNPASNNYKRVLVYPILNKRKIIFNVLGFVEAIGALTLLLWLATRNVLITVLVPSTIGFLYILLRLSSIIIFFIECYQLLAPARVRMRCRFEPSCSQYMILAIKKYGVIKGGIKGIKRIKRCHFPNGGYDNP